MHSWLLVLRSLFCHTTALAAVALLPLTAIAQQNPYEDPTGGQDTESDPAEAQPDEAARLVPPELLEFSQATYPPAAEAAGEEAAVDLLLTIDTEGTVTEATVTNSAGEAFDAAAVEAALRFRFAPARRGETPIAARIGYRYVFELTPVTPPATGPGGDEAVEAPPAVADLLGRILDRDGDEAIAEAEVVLTPQAGGESQRAVSDADGAFRFAELPLGAYELAVFAEGYESFATVEQAEADTETTLTYRLSAQSDGVGFRARAVVEAPPREVVRRRITREELLRVPGTRGDALRTVELLPGVGRPAFGVGQLLVRGSGPNDSAVFLDGIEVPLLYHFGGLTSFFNSQLLEQIDFVPGNFSVRYGRQVGGILEVQSRAPASDAVHGVADVNIIDASLLVEAPISENLSFAVAGRRSYIDFWFENVLPDDAFDVVTAPVYYDYQAALNWDASDRDQLRLMVYGSSDRFNAVFSDPADTDPNLRGDLDLTTQFHRLFLGWDHKLSNSVDQQVQFSVGPTLLNFGFGDAIRFDATFWQMVLRSEWRTRLNSRVQLRSGIDLNLIPFSLEYQGPPVTQQEGSGQQDPITGQETQFVDTSGVVFRPGAYVEADVRPIAPLRLVLGVRLDYYSEIEAWSVDPRLVALLSLNSENRIKFGAGLFSQPPEFQESSDDLGNPNLRPFRALHLAMGYERDFDEGIRAGAEAFYKYLWDRPVSQAAADGGAFVNEGVGQIYGLELSARILPQGRRYFGFLSYTFSRSERRDISGTPWRLFDFDQTHILSASFSYLLGDGWELGGTFRLVSGNPETPAVPFGRLNLNSGVVQAINGAINSERAPFFHRFDVRIAKRWDFDDWKFTLYLDVQNAYNATNPEASLYDWRYVNRTEVPGLPIIPSLGVRGEL